LLCSVLLAKHLSRMLTRNCVVAQTDRQDFRHYQEREPVPPTRNSRLAAMTAAILAWPANVLRQPPSTASHQTLATVTLKLLAAAEPTLTRVQYCLPCSRGAD
jgi:hypothetical protein